MISKKNINQKLSEIIKLRHEQIISDATNVKREAERNRQRAESYVSDINSLFKKNNFDISAFNELEEKRATIAIEETAEVRKTLLNSLPDNIEKNFEVAEGNYGYSFLEPTNTRQYDSDGNIVVEGPSIKDVDIMAKDKGEGSGLHFWATAVPAGYRDAIVDRYFYFIPPVTGVYRLTVNQRLNGFYIVRADDGVLSSKRARITLDGYIKVFQYYGDTLDFTVLDHDDDNINKSGRFDKFLQANYNVVLGGNDPVFVQFTLQFDAYARGGGSEAELNFKDGNANSVRQPLLYVTGP